jgi:hypothetical protein
VRAGDILLYRHGRGAIAHRVVHEASSRGGRPILILRGDAADCCDSPIELNQVLGRVVAVERRGRVVRFGLRTRIWSPVLARALRWVRVARTTIAELSTKALPTK